MCRWTPNLALTLAPNRAQAAAQATLAATQAALSHGNARRFLGGTHNLQETL